MSELKVLSEEKVKMIDQSRRMEQELKTIQAQEQVIVWYHWLTHSNKWINISIAKSKREITKLDAQKLHKPLKESFRARIYQFREGFYLLTGYKIDMVSKFNRPKFKVRSMHAEKESDILEFIWPELEEGKSPISLDMLNTKLGQELSKEPCFKYIERYESLPAFMASVCLSLFEKQTMV